MADPPLQSGPDALEQLLNSALGQHRNGQFGAAERHYRSILNIRPNHPEARHWLGVLRFQQGRHQEALDLVTRALRAKPDYPEAHYNFGNILARLERHEEAIASFDRAIAIVPDYAEAHLNRGSVLLMLKRHADALASFDHALAIRPDYAEAHDGRGNALLSLQRYDDALASYDRALELSPGNAALLNNRGNLFTAQRRFTEALASYDQALAIAPDDPELLSNRGNVLTKLGRHQEAVASYDRVLAIRPDAAVYSGKIFVLDFLPEAGSAERQEARRIWYQTYVKPTVGAILPHANSPDPSRRLVLGYVSSDFREHSAATTFGPVLRRHDHASFQVICYSGGTVEDELTREFERCADVWRPIRELSDEALAAQIRADGIDILIDLSGHSAGHRLPIFAHKLAPVQVTAWGHPTGTGIPTIDYLFGDPVSTPEPVRPFYAEKIYDLPCLITFEAPSYAPPVLELPAQSRGVVTFGCLNRFMKVSPALLELWAEILRSVPGSRLLLKDNALDDVLLRAEVTEKLVSHGVGTDRIDLRGGTARKEHLETFNDVDIVLDPFPNNGGISTWEALSSGVPVVTKPGESLPSRVGAAILSAIGLPDWVADNDRQYVRLAIEKATNLKALALLRKNLRTIIWASPAGNPELYTRAVEDGYRVIWRRWCNSSKPA